MTELGESRRFNQDIVSSASATSTTARSALRFRDLRKSTIRTGASERSSQRTATTDQPHGSIPEVVMSLANGRLHLSKDSVRVVSVRLEGIMID